MSDYYIYLYFICNILQDSLHQLKRQVIKHPSIVASDFDITRDGKLQMRSSPTPGLGGGGDQRPFHLQDTENNNKGALQGQKVS